MISNSRAVIHKLYLTLESPSITQIMHALLKLSVNHAKALLMSFDVKFLHVIALLAVLSSTKSVVSQKAFLGNSILTVGARFNIGW